MFKLLETQIVKTCPTKGGLKDEITETCKFWVEYPVDTTKVSTDRGGIRTQGCHSNVE